MWLTDRMPKVSTVLLSLHPKTSADSVPTPDGTRVDVDAVDVIHNATYKSCAAPMK